MELGHRITNEEYFRLKGTLPADRIEKMLDLLKELEEFLVTLKEGNLDSIRFYVREDELHELLDATADALGIPVTEAVVEAFTKKEANMYRLSVEADSQVDAMKESITSFLERM